MSVSLLTFDFMKKDNFQNWDSELNFETIRIYPHYCIKKEAILFQIYQIVCEIAHYEKIQKTAIDVSHCFKMFGG
jgi:hypothetical protein